MRVLRAEVVPVRTKDDVVIARRIVRAWAVGIGFGLVDQTRLVTAASELARNTVDHGGGGTMRVEHVDGDDPRTDGLRMTFEDQGPGIPDVARALQAGFSTGGGLGLGLSGSRRLMHDFLIESSPGEGTRVAAVRWRER